ncbi:MAG TPA: hypothetical protein VD860_17005 [Azospirillum sp.]|nr:hypothetical protein [Azospirillum sp.]
MSDLNKGEVAFTVDGAEYTLRPSLNAFNRLASGFDNYVKIVEKIATMHAPTMGLVLKLGLGWNDTQAKKLPDLMFRAGIPALIDPLSDYVFRLFNGGKSVDEINAEAASKVEKEAAGAEGEENPLFGA